MPKSSIQIREVRLKVRGLSRDGSVESTRCQCVIITVLERKKDKPHSDKPENKIGWCTNLVNEKFQRNFFFSKSKPTYLVMFLCSWVN